jgi:hypothetical protein
MLLVPSVTHLFLRLIGVLIDEMARGIHIPERIGVEVGIEVMGFKTFIGDLVVVARDTDMQGIEDSIR